MQPDLILTGANLLTMNPGQPSATALAIVGGVIVAVGEDAAIESLAGPHTRRLKLAGETVIPGINDAHVHLWKVGMLLSQVNARPAQAPTLPALVQNFAARAQITPPGAWIEGRGYDETRLPERRHPTRYDLDQASTIHPIVLGRTCGHIIVANSRALELAGINRNTPDPVGGELDRDAQGEPTGVLRETAMSLVRAIQPPVTEAELEAAILGAGRLCPAMGITSIGDPGVDERIVSVYRALDAAERLPIRCDVMAMTIDPAGHRATPPKPWRGRFAKVDTCKIFSDGGLSGGTAALSIPYKGRHDCGLPRFPVAQLTEEISRVHQAGVTVAVHSIGDSAIGQVLDAFELCRAREGAKSEKIFQHSDDISTASRHPRLRIEHFGLPNAAHMEKARSLDVMVATQPSFLYDIGDSILHFLPDALVPQCYPFKAMLEAGLTVSFSSDGPVIADINPMLGLQSAVLRRTRTGRAIALEQSIGVAQALWCFTMGSARVSGMGDTLGCLAPGYQADLAILSANPLTVPVEKLLEIRVLQTLVAGQVAFVA